ncbi:hypothetical protein RB195_005806 [Necator americanus]|uniref:Uncharacterized protein n=1 Tax=Necator americanus TaxID=51031 RepID=A0ABR1BR54_NECAM
MILRARLKSGVAMRQSGENLQDKLQTVCRSSGLFLDEIPTTQTEIIELSDYFGRAHVGSSGDFLGGADLRAE